MGVSLKDLAFLGIGILILLDRGSSWWFILGVGLLAVGANRIARSI